MKKRILCFALIITLTTIMTIAPAAADVAPLTKSESVYAKVSSDGSETYGVYVVNEFEIPEGYEGYSFPDYGKYVSVTNLTGSDKLEIQGDKVQVVATEGAFYYQGNMAEGTELPWTIKITHRLDGKIVTASEIAGASGQWQMDIEIERKEDFADAEQFTLQVQVTLDSRKFRDIHAGNASIAANGYNKVLNFTMLSGGGSGSVEAEAEDFELDRIQIAAVHAELPIDVYAIADSVEIDTTAITEQITELQDGVSKLNSGAAQLKQNGGTLVEGANAIAEATISTASQQLQTQMSSFGIEVPELTRENYAEVLDGLAENMPIAKAQFEEAKEQISGILQFADGVQQYVGGVGELAGGISQLNEGISGFDVGTTIDETMSEVMESVLANYMPGEYNPDSFAAPGHSVKSLQFVIMTEEIKVPEAETSEAVEVKLTFWQKLLKLFGLYKG